MTTQPLVLNLAPTGIVPTRDDSPHVPLQPAEIVRDVVAAAGIGISIVHLHARDSQGRPTYRKEVYARIIGGIRDCVPDAVVCVSCSGRQGLDVNQRSEVLELTGDLKPDMASLTLSSLNFSRQASVNAPDTIKALASRMADRGIKPELEIFDLGMCNMLEYLLDRGLVRPPLYANLLFGNLATAQARLLEMGVLIERLPPDTLYSLAGLGATQLNVAAIAAATAPGVRIGLEDNLWLDPARQRLATNGELVGRVHQFAAGLGRRIATSGEVRQLLGLDGAHQRASAA